MSLFIIRKKTTLSSRISFAIDLDDYNMRIQEKKAQGEDVEETERVARYSESKLMPLVDTILYELSNEKSRRMRERTIALHLELPFRQL